MDILFQPIPYLYSDTTPHTRVLQKHSVDQIINCYLRLELHTYRLLFGEKSKKRNNTKSSGPSILEEALRKACGGFYSGGGGTNLLKMSARAGIELKISRRLRWDSTTRPLRRPNASIAWWKCGKQTSLIELHLENSRRIANNDWSLVRPRLEVHDTNKCRCIHRFSSQHRCYQAIQHHRQHRNRNPIALLARVTRNNWRCVLCYNNPPPHPSFHGPRYPRWSLVLFDVISSLYMMSKLFGNITLTGISLERGFWNLNEH